MATSRASTDFGLKADNYYLQTANFLNPGTDDLTACAWVQVFNLPGGPSSVVFAQRDQSGTGRNWISIDSNVFQTFLGGSLINFNTVITLNTWIHIAVTCAAGAAQTFNAYYNGAIDATASITMEATAGAHRIGAHKSNTSCNWDGLIVYPQIYNAVLSQSEIQDIMHNPFAYPDNLQWMPDLLQDGTYRDLSPAQRKNPTVVGTLTASALGPPVFL